MMVALFFTLKIGSALLILLLSTSMLSVEGFAAFTQLTILAALINTIAVGGAQTGLIRIAAAAFGEAELARPIGGAIALWAAIAAAGTILVIVLRGPISVVLIGTTELAPYVVFVGLATFAGGPGQILTALLTGRGYLGRSLSAQAFGLFAGAALALFFLARGDPFSSAVAFAGQAPLTMIAAFVLAQTRRLPRPSFDRLKATLREILCYSSATLTLAVATMLVLFALRFGYQETFGLTLLGYWLAANRISDTSTQFVGLGYLQLLVPRLTRVEDPQEARRLIATSWAIATATMAGPLAVFLLALITLCPQLLCEFWNGAYCSGPFVGKLPGSAIFLGGFRDVDRFRLGA
jgi:O-antigen/teichoic acid export membrane protein